MGAWTPLRSGNHANIRCFNANVSASTKWLLKKKTCQHGHIVSVNKLQRHMDQARSFLYVVISKVPLI